MCSSTHKMGRREKGFPSAPGFRIAGRLDIGFCAAMAVQQSISSVAFPETKHAVTAFNEAGEVLLPAVPLQLDIVYPRGRKERGNLTVVYDPEYQHCLWRYFPHADGNGLPGGMPLSRRRRSLTSTCPARRFA